MFIPPRLGLPSTKSETCVGSISRMPLTEYASEDAAYEGASYERFRSGRRLAPYRCGTCGNYHLAPRERMVDATIACGCTNSSGEPKALYKSQRDAMKRVDMLRRERGMDLDVYPCEVGLGWHLTKARW